MQSESPSTSGRWTIFAVLASLGALAAWLLISKRKSCGDEEADGLDGLFRVCDRALSSLDRDESAA